MPKQVYISSVVGRLTVRYYLIIVNHRYYLIDYSDPLKLSNYYLFGLLSRKYTIYDVTKDRYQFVNQVNQKYISKYWDNIIAALFIGIYEYFNLFTVVTFDPRILMNLKFMFKLEILIIIFIFLFLIRKNKFTPDLSRYKSYDLKITVPKKPNKLAVTLFSIVYYFILVTGWWSVIFYYSSYASIFLISLFAVNFILFNKFFYFSIRDAWVKSKKGKVYRTRAKFFIEEKS